MLRVSSSFFPFTFLQAVEDVNVTYEDQQKINKFARNTSRMTELKNEIESKKVSNATSGRYSSLMIITNESICIVPVL